jgi:hypothetical protein
MFVKMFPFDKVVVQADHDSRVVHSEHAVWVPTCCRPHVVWRGDMDLVGGTQLVRVHQLPGELVVHDLPVDGGVAVGG